MERQHLGRGLEACPICLEGRGVTTSSWAITACGHEGCYDCMDAAVADMRAAEERHLASQQDERVAHARAVGELRSQLERETAAMQEELTLELAAPRARAPRRAPQSSIWLR